MGKGTSHPSQIMRLIGCGEDEGGGGRTIQTNDIKFYVATSRGGGEREGEEQVQ